jgi:outer membrane biogenesis lipoprotein LolB
MKQIQNVLAVGLILSVAAIALLLAGCTGSNHTETTQSDQSTGQKSEKAVQYTCSMHPEVVQDKPGDCPKCGMKLVEKK